MGKVTVQDINIHRLKKIDLPGGGVLRGLRKSDQDYIGFGEAYFSQVDFGAIKAWKLHTKMTMNIMVPIGEVHFAFIDEMGGFRTETLGANNYARLSVPPGIWFGFKGLNSPSSLILNISDIPHNPKEIERKDLNSINFDWS